MKFVPVFLIKKTKNSTSCCSWGSTINNAKGLDLFIKIYSMRMRILYQLCLSHALLLLFSLFLGFVVEFFLILSKCSILPFHLNLWLSIIYLLQPSSSNALLLLIYSVSMRRLHQWCLFHALLLLISLFLGFTATTVLLATEKEILLQFKRNINNDPYIRLNQNQN